MFSIIFLDLCEEKYAVINGEKYIIRSLVICTPYPILCWWKIEKNEMGGARGAYGGGERCAQSSGRETRGKEKIGEAQT